MHRLPRPSPALVVALAALFFALGGTAFALGTKIVPQARCATGAVRGIATIGGGVDLSTLSNSFTEQPDAVTYHWSCTGGKVLIRKDPGAASAVDVQFVGNSAAVAIVSSAANGVANGGSVARQSDGSFRVVMGGSNVGAAGPWQSQWNVPFVLVLL